MGRLTVSQVCSAKPGIGPDGKPRKQVLVDVAERNAFANGNSQLDRNPLMLRKLLTLAEPREKAAALRKLATAGSNPIAERDREQPKIRDGGCCAWGGNTGRG
ncbi:hypothetical protein [Novosphingobium sp.]|uniref:hypothetical protein n=1 Tax=Novosphingobium sp. TaxID=1874826 RepID=UPI003BAC80C6